MAENENTNGSADTSVGSISLGSDKRPNEHVIIQQAMASASSTFKTDENYVYDVTSRIARVQAVMDIGGSMGQKQATRAYDRMDFDNDAYLNRIGMGSDGSSQKALNNFMSNYNFESVTDAALQGATIKNNEVIFNTSHFTADDLSQIKESKNFSYNGVSYNASVGSDGNVHLTNSSSYGSMFQQTESSQIKIDLDPTAGISTLHTSISSQCLSTAEKDSIKEHGSFERGGVTYNAHVAEDKSLNISTSFANGSTTAHAVYAQNNVLFSRTTTQVNGSSLNISQVQDVVKNNGTYDLGGMKFSVVPQANFGFDKSKAQTLLNNANNEYANNRAKVDVRGHADKANVIYDIQRKGQSYICSQSSYLKDNFNGHNAKSCISHIDKEISTLMSKKPAGWESKLAALQDQKNLLVEYNKHGGKIQNPTKSKSTMGKDIVMGKLIGSDMMTGVNFYRSGFRAVKKIYGGTTGTMAAIGYHTSSFSNKTIQKMLSEVNGKDYVGVQKLQALQKSVDKRYDIRKERIKAKKEGRYKEWKRDYKNEKFTAKGQKLETKGTNLEAKKAKTQTKRAGLSKDERFSNAKDTFLRKKEERLERRINRNNKSKQAFASDSLKRKKKSGPGVLQKLRTKFSNSIFGKIFGVIKNIADLPKMLLAKLKAWVIKVLVAGIAAYIQMMIKMTAIFIVLFLILLFVSSIPTALPTNVTDRLLNSANYQQMIIDITEQDIVQDLQIICEVDATNHFLSKRHIKHSSYPWYYAVKMGEIAHVWTWEESDNTTRYANEGDKVSYDENGQITGFTGDLVYANENIEYGENGNTYVSESMRQSLSNIEANLLPIVTMGHLRYFDDIDFNRWPTVLGYTYYMFSLSHDIARYDTDALYNHRLYGDMEEDPGYDYRIEDFCGENGDPIYGEEAIQWDPETHTLTRGTELCQNIYIHDFAAEGHECGVTSVTLEHASEVSNNPVTKSVREISLAAQKFFGKFSGNQAEYADTFDKGYTDSNSILTLNLRKASLKGIKNRELSDLSIGMSIEQIAARYSVVDIDKNKSGIFMYDDSPESLPHAQSEVVVEGRELNGLGEACDNVLYFAYGVTEDDGASEGDSDVARLIPGEDTGAVDDCHDHSWTKGCFTCICGQEERDATWVDEGGNPVSEPVEGGHYDSGHTHTISCYDLSSYECAHGKAYASTGGHAPWNSEQDHGCWKTVSICGGHCGGHITPLINIVQKMTYEGLAQDDNFKTTYWLEAEEVTSSGGYEYGSIFGLLDNMVGNNIVTVGQFRAYWMLKCNTWFSPFPRSPYGFAKTIIKSAITEYCEKWDALATGINCVLNYVSGGVLGNEEENTDTSMDDWAKKNTEDGDMWQWDGWWNDNDTIDISLISEMESYTGTYKDEYASGKKNWEDFGITFGSYGLSNPIYTPDEIESFISQIEASYDFNGLTGLTEKQKAILEAALSRCGTFSYSLSGTGHNNAINNDSGQGDCSGWVTGTLLKALGVNYNTNAAGYANKGVYNGTKTPGCVIANKNGGKNYSGHVMIYAGYLEDGPDGAGYYVMDCSSSQGGSSFRRMTEKQLSKYNYVWNP